MLAEGLVVDGAGRLRAVVKVARERRNDTLVKVRRRGDGDLADRRIVGVVVRLREQVQGAESGRS